ncbi:hypothetical protein [Reyranella sp.]|uniref:hypothetical protein n=1 Tax=Reyranella sp. TaxID=1929291 RepID=UPI003BA94DCD
MLTFDIRSTGALVRAGLNELQRKHLPKAQMEAAKRTGSYVHAALRSEMEEVFDRPTRWALGGLRWRNPSAARPEFRIWLEEFGGKGIPAADFLAAEIEGGTRRLKRMEKALQARGLMPKGWFAVPGRQAPLDAHGNVPGSFIVRMLSDLQAFGEQGYRANRRGRRTGARKTNYFFVPRKGSHLKPGIYWHMPNRMLGCVFAFVSKASYQKRYDFYGVGQRAFNRVALRFMSEALAKLVRRDNR